MSAIEKIKSPVKRELEEFEPFYKEAVKTKIPMLNIIMHYVLRRKGKQMRPLMIFLCAGLVGKISERSYHAALTIELLHTATLIHDDVVDDAYQRRGMFSIKALWRNKISILVGDYILGKGLIWCVEHKEYDFLHHISESVSDMSEGEILQIEKARKLDITRDVYFDIINKKTASLLATSAALGANSTTDDTKIINKLKDMGRFAGIAFQIKDDLFDYEKTNMTGKPTGNDIIERKITLPLIYALENSTTKTQKKILALLRRKNKTRDHIDYIHSFVKNNGGMEHAEIVMNEYKEKALEILFSFPNSPYREALEEYIHFITKRNK